MKITSSKDFERPDLFFEVESLIEEGWVGLYVARPRVESVIQTERGETIVTLKRAGKRGRLSQYILDPTTGRLCPRHFCK
jgi:hypothetical protein